MRLKLQTLDIDIIKSIADSTGLNTIQIENIYNYVKSFDKVIEVLKHSHNNNISLGKSAEFVMYGEYL